MNGETAIAPQSPDRAGDLYTSGDYWRGLSSMHEDDSEHKVMHARRLLDRHAIRPNSILDCGCGAGRVAYLFAGIYGCDTLGIDASETAIDHARRTYRHDRLDYACTLIGDVEGPQRDLGVMFDVFEHVDDYLGFLSLARTKARHWIFNIPLDMSVMHLLDGTYMARRRRVGHLHYFTKASALATLETAGFYLIDQRYADYHRGAFADARRWQEKLRLLPGRLLFGLHKDWAVLWFGGASLVVLADTQKP